MVIKQNKGYKLPLSKTQIINLYISGQSCYQLAKTCKCTPQSIYFILTSTNTSRRSLSQAATKHTHNIDYFKKINTEAKAYFLGLLYADGNIYKNKLSISLQDKDKHILETFKNSILATNPIYKITKKEANRQLQWELSISGKNIVQDLLTHGLYPNKGFSLTFPTTIPDYLIHHFIRGYFDGDGCIYHNPKRYDYLFSIVATKEVNIGIQDILIKILHLNKTNLYNPPKMINKNLYILTYQGGNSVRKIRDYLYKNATIYLQRKYDKFYSF